MSSEKKLHDEILEKVNLLESRLMGDKDAKQD